MPDDAPPGRRAIRSSEPSPENDLVAAAVAGDSAAFGRLLQRHDDKMRGVVWRVVGSSSAMDDILQDAYLKAWRSIGRYRREAAFSSWLYTIVHRCAIDWVRSRRHFAVTTEIEFPEPAAVDHAGSVAEALALQRALSELPADQLAVVTLIDGEGRSYDEVAELLDISGGTVASRLHRARAALRAHLAETGDVR